MGQRPVRQCGLCGTQNFKFWFTKDGYDIVRCRDCGLTQVLQDVPDEVLTSLYGQGYYEGANEAVYQNYMADPSTKQQHFGAKLDQIVEANHLRPGDCLEIGCAFGLFLAAAKERGWTVRGIERSTHAAEWARKNLGIDVDTSLNALARVPTASQDLVAMWDVLEHVKHPKEVIGEIRRVLRPGGLLVCQTCDVESTSARFHGKRWWLLTPPYHLIFWAQSTLHRLFEENGFTVRQTTHEGLHPLENFGWSKIWDWLMKKERYVGWRVGTASIITVTAVAR